MYLISFFLLFIHDQPVHNSGSSAYGSLNSNDHLLGITSSSESLNNGCGSKMQQEEEEVSSKARPVSKYENTYQTPSVLLRLLSTSSNLDYTIIAHIELSDISHHVWPPDCTEWPYVLYI